MKLNQLTKQIYYTKVLKELQERKKQKEKAKEQFSFFLKEILNYDFLCDEKHTELIYWIKDNRKRKLLQATRLSGKSTMITVGYVLWRILRNPNLRVLIVSATDDLSTKYLREIKNQIENNLKITRIYGNIKPALNKFKKWDHHEIELQGKTKYRESNVKCIGVNTPPTGDHYDLIVFDDIVNVEDVNSAALRDEKKIKFAEILSNILVPDGKAIVIGTAWHEDDLYQNLIKMNYQFKEKDKWDIKIIPAKVEEELMFPSLVNQDKIDTAYLELGYSMCRKQYFLEIIPEDTLFSTTNFKYFNYYKLDFEQLTISAFIDIAEKTSERSDFTAIVTMAKNKKLNEFYILDSWIEKLTPTRYIEKILELFQKWNYVKLGIETNKSGYMFIQLLKKEAMEKNIYLPIVEVNHTTNKDSRIRRLEPLINQGIILFPEDWNVRTKRLIEQFVKYDGGKEHDDGPDACEGVFSLLNVNIFKSPFKYFGGDRQFTKIK